MAAVEQNIMFHSFLRFWLKNRGETDQLDPCFCQLSKESFLLTSVNLQPSNGNSSTRLRLVPETSILRLQIYFGSQKTFLL